MTPTIRSSSPETPALPAQDTIRPAHAAPTPYLAPDPTRSQQNRVGLAAHDSAMRSSITMPLAAPEGGFLDLGQTHPASGREGGASSHRASFVNDGQHVYRVKFNHHGAVATFHEVVAARMNQLLFPGRIAPEVKFGAHTDTLPDAASHSGEPYSGVAIASRMLPGFQDLGDFLIWSSDDYHLDESARTCSALPHVASDRQADYLDLLREHQHNRQSRLATESQIRREHPELIPLLNNSKTDYTQWPAQSIARLEPLRRHDAAGLALRHKMLTLLPRSFQTALQQALYESEAIGDWDYANHDLFNVSPIIQNGVLMGATVIDFGVCGPIGFSGQRKQDNAQHIQRPARVDDPYLHLGEADGELRKMPAIPYPGGQLLDIARVTDPTDLSHTADPTALLPRAGSYRRLMADVMPQQREFGRLPAPMIKTAARLSQVAPEQIDALVHGLWKECANNADPAIVAMLRAVEQTGDSAASISALYCQRRSKIIERTGSHEIEKWMLRHPERASEAPF